MRDAMILIAKMISDEKAERINQSMIKFGKTRGLWCADGVMMNPSSDNLDRMLDHMKRKNIKTVITETKVDILNVLDKEMLEERLKQQGVSCLCRRENIVLGVQDDTLLLMHKPKALLVYEDEDEVAAMREYVEEKGYAVEDILLETNLKDEQMKKLLKEIVDKDIDAVVMPTADYFNSEDYTTPLVFALYEHGIQVHIAELRSIVSDVFSFALHQHEPEKPKQQESSYFMS